MAAVAAAAAVKSSAGDGVDNANGGRNNSIAHANAHANFRDLRDAWEVKSTSSSSTQKAGNCDADNERRRQLRQDEIYSLQQSLSWDRDETPILAWQRQHHEGSRRRRGGVGGGGLYCNSHSNFNSSALSYQSQSSTLSSMHSISKDIEEEAKHKLLAFLSKPDGLNWEDLVRSLASEKMEKKSKKSGRSRARSPSPEPQAASMLNKVITVISHSGSTVYDDDISEMESDENVERFSKRERKKRDRLESMIEGVVMGKIAVDVGDVFRKKVDRIVLVESRSGSQQRHDWIDEYWGDCIVEEARGDHDRAEHSTKRDTSAAAELYSEQTKSKDSCVIARVESPPQLFLLTPQSGIRTAESSSTNMKKSSDYHNNHAGGGNDYDRPRSFPPPPDLDFASESSGGNAIRDYNHIASPPKTKSLSKLCSAFTPVKSMPPIILRSGENGEYKTKISIPHSQGTPHTTPMSISSKSSVTSSSNDCETHRTPIIVADGENVMVFRPAETVHHHHHYHHHIPPNVKGKKAENSSRSRRSRSSPPLPLISSETYSTGRSNLMPLTPLLLSSDACPISPTSTNTSISSSCSGGGWSSATTESVTSPSIEPVVHRVGICPRIVTKTMMASSGAAAIRRARHEQRHGQLPNINSFSEYSPKESRNRCAGLDSLGHGARTSEVSDRSVKLITNSYSSVSRNVERQIDNAYLERWVQGAIDKGCRLSPNLNGALVNAAVGCAAGGVGHDHAIGNENWTRIVNCPNGISTTSITSSARKDIDGGQNEIGVATRNDVLFAPSSTTTTITTNTLVGYHTVDAAISADEVLPILIRPETLTFNERRPSCWQMTRHRMFKTRGEF